MYRGFLEDAFPERVRRVVVYGVWTRGETVASSPVKLLLLVTEATPEERLYATDLARQIGAEQGLTFDAVVLSVPQWNELERRQGHFVRDVARDGVDITLVGASTLDGRVDLGQRRNTA